MTDDKSIFSLSKSIKSNDINEVLFSLNQIRVSGDPKIIFNILDLLISNPPLEISKAIIELLNDVKNQSVTEVIAKALEEERFFPIRKELIVSCWSSGLDYSKHLNLFVDIFISSDFLIAFEAFTLIETFENLFSEEIINPLIAKLKSNLTKMPDMKKSLLLELVHLLEEKRN